MRTLPAVALLATLACSGGAQPRPGSPPPTPTTSPAPATTTERPPLPRSMAALGDSMTRAFLACADLGDCPSASWATGNDDDVDSHASRIRRAGGRQLAAHNLAVSGAAVRGLADQARRAVALEPDYVTVLVGANDACAPDERSMTPVDEFAGDFDRALGILASGLPDALILVVSIPDVFRLWEIGHERADVRGAWQRFGVCASMLGDAADSSDAARARRARVRETVAAYNAAMARSCARHAHCRWDGNAVYDHEFTLDDVTPRDYWHPSRAGQRTLAEVTWRAGFWA